jgi:hypothetical protein
MGTHPCGAQERGDFAPLPQVLHRVIGIIHGMCPDADPRPCLPTK